MSELLSSLFTKERSWANRSCCSLKRSYVVIISRFEQICLKKSYIFYSFSLLFPFFMAKSESLFTKEQPCMSKSLPSLITKEQLWVIRSRRSLQIALLILCSFAFCSFAHEKRVIRSKIRRANSQNWKANSVLPGQWAGTDRGSFPTECSKIGLTNRRTDCTSRTLHTST